MMMRLSTLLASFSMLLFLSCSDTETYTYDVWTPVYIPLSEFRSAVRVQGPQSLSKPGKIYVKDSYLFINEQDKGIHIFDNSDPSNPKNLSFIAIPGNGDMAVKGTTLYADSYIDLVALDISVIANIHVTKRIQSIFPNCLNSHGMWVDTAKGIAIEWKKETKTEVIRRSYSPVEYNYRTGGRDLTMNTVDVSGPGSGTGTTGVGGSMARFTIYDKTLYAVSQSDLQMFAIDNPAKPLVWAKMNVGWNIETIFPYRDKLFIGSQSALFIYENKDQRNPVQLCQFRHGRSCDPVVVNGDVAYVTLRSGSTCGGAQNQLDIVDIKDLTNPKLIHSYSMQEPFGVGIDGQTLFVCDGVAGLKVYNTADLNAIQLRAFMPEFKTYDVIPLGTVAIVVGPDGLYQYDYSNPDQLVFLSKIEKLP